MKHINILIVDDHSILRNAIARNLGENPEFKCYQAENGGDALEIVNTNSIDIIFLDINMPKINGILIAKEILRSSTRTNAKIIVLSAYNEPSLIFNLLQIGVKGYLSKDVGTEELVDAIHYVNAGGVYYQKQYDKILKKLARDYNYATLEAEK